MRHCHHCGQRIQEDTGVQRSLQTGNYGTGGAYYRTVNLCAGCSDGLFSAARSARLTRILVVLAGIVLLFAGSAYLIWTRQG